MKNKLPAFLALALLSTLSHPLPALHAQGTVFVYQGRLNDNGQPANGTNYGMVFYLYDAPTNGNLLGNLGIPSVTVSNGLFTTPLSFGGTFDGNPRWLEISLQKDGGGFTTLTPRQPVTPAPYAMFANTASNLSGTISNSSLPSSPNFPGAVTAGSFAGGGSNLTSLNAGSITAGMLSDARLSGNVALRGSANTFTAPQFFNGQIVLNSSDGFAQSSAGAFYIDAPFIGGGRFTVLENGNVGIGTNAPSQKLVVAGNAAFTGTITGNGALPWQIVAGTTQPAQSNTGYLLTNNSLVTVTLPASPNLGDVVRLSSAGTGGWKIAQNAGQFVSSASLSGNIGIAWTARDTNRLWTSVASSADGAKLVAVVNGGQIYGSTDSGATWTALLINNNWQSIASSADGTKLVAVVNGGQIYTYSPSGGWMARDSSRNWYSVASSADGAKLVAGVAGGQIYTSTDSGATWTPRDSNRNWLSVASSADGTKLVAGSAGGQIYTSTDSGVTWTPRDSSRSWWSVASSADGAKLVAVVSGSQIYASSDSGVTWTPRDSSRGWYSVASSADGARLVVVVAGGQIYTSVPSSVSGTTTGTAGYLLGNQNTAIELQYVGGGQFQPISHEGIIQAF